MSTYLAADHLPGQGVVWGDLHHHSGLTEDAIEFGAPLEASRAAATALGLGFVAVTDHSYDLDDRIGSWRLTDPELTKWHTSRRRMAELNRESSAALLLPSEELSVRNSRGRNVHALVLDHPHFLPGSGDGGERVLRRPSELNLTELTATAQSPAVVIAAHPYQPVPWLQRLVIGRDNWSAPDLATAGIAGLQIMNGRLDAGFWHGLGAWIRLLLQGERTYIYAGSDSHGDFNRFRVIGLPFVYLTERDGMTLGSCRTGVLGVKPGDQAGIMSALSEGRCLISNGPSIDLEVRGDGSSAGPGASLPGGDLEVRLRLASTAEFGPLTRLRLYRGIIGAPREDLLVDLLLGSGRYEFRWRHKLRQTQAGYLRAEAQSRLPNGNVFGNHLGLALTNPVWIEAVS
ncbi:MAG: CehA/McbA family metallohydrolase [Candidatus Marinimicrobia bacterium]|nr:CehA/McbA family metallohydrolase [Candidatus Neomarinimicrobiota bacterium]